MTVLDACELAVCDDAELVRRAAAGDARPRRVLIAPYVPLAAQARAALPLSPCASMACGEWSMSDTTEG